MKTPRNAVIRLSAFSRSMYDAPRFVSRLGNLPLPPLDSVVLRCSSMKSFGNIFKKFNRTFLENFINNYHSSVWLLRMHVDR